MLTVATIHTKIPASRDAATVRPRHPIYGPEVHTMISRKLSVLLLLSLLLALAAPVIAGDNSSNATAVPAPPKTSVNEVKELLHGTEIVDPYRWLEDQNSPETRAWIDAQNAYTDSLISKFPRREALRQQVSALLKIDSMSAPLVRGGRYFIAKRSADQDQVSEY